MKKLLLIITILSTSAIADVYKSVDFCISHNAARLGNSDFNVRIQLTKVHNFGYVIAFNYTNGVMHFNKPNSDADLLINGKIIKLSLASSVFNYDTEIKAYNTLVIYAIHESQLKAIDITSRMRINTINENIVYQFTQEVIDMINNHDKACGLVDKSVNKA